MKSNGLAHLIVHETVLISGIYQHKRMREPRGVVQNTGLEETIACCAQPRASLSGVYAIRCPAGAYVGRTRDMRVRWANHRAVLRRGKHHSRRLQAAWDKYGESAFQFEVVSLNPSDEARCGLAYGARCLNADPFDKSARAKRMRDCFLHTVPTQELLAEIKRRHARVRA